MRQGFPHQLPVLENYVLHTNVACSDVTISRVFPLYEIAFILLSYGQINSRDSVIFVKRVIYITQNNGQLSISTILHKYMQVSKQSTVGKFCRQMR